MERQLIGHYEVLDKIAEGGFGVVYNAHDTRLKRDVAIKVLHTYHASDPARVARFLREARSAAKLQHPGIVQVHDVVEMDGQMALVMEFIRGVNLDVYLQEHLGLTLADKLEIGAQVAETLSVAHEAGIIHRDVKPANVMIDVAGRVKLTDFSLARLLDSSLTQLTGDNNVLGTPAYMSPEQCQGENAVPQSDLYSLGVMIYEMAAGALPFEAENYLALLRHHTDTPPTPIRLIRPTLPVELEKLIIQCLEKDPELRPASGTALAERLREIAHEHPERPIDVQRADTVTLPAPPSKRITPPPRPIPRTEPEPETAAQTVPANEEAIRGQDERGLPKERTWRRKALVLAGMALVALVVALALRGTLSDEPITTMMPEILTSTPLADYVRAEDLRYEYEEVVEPIQGDGYTAHVFDVTSQTWHADEVKPRVWRHWLTMVVPERVMKDKALLVLTDGLGAADQPPATVPRALIEIAEKTNSVVAAFDGFPREPVGFYDEADMAEDMDPDEFAVASFMQFLETGDPTWPVVCPLVKSVVRAMDTVQDYAANTLELDTPIEAFVITGSGNGWATWLTGAVDERVAAIAPIQFGLVDLVKQIEHQAGKREALSPFLEIFSESGAMSELETERGEELLEIIDPYYYRDKLAMPKLLLLPAGVETMTTVDGVSLYYDELFGDTHLFCVPNLEPSDMGPLLTPSEKDEDKAGLGEDDGLMWMPPKPEAQVDVAQELRDTLSVFYHKLLVDKPMPKFSWTISDDGEFQLTCEDMPAEVRLWVAESDTRDFRYETIGATWQMEKHKIDDGKLAGNLREGKGKYRAFCLELVYPSSLGINASVTTPVTVLEPLETRRQLAFFDPLSAN